MTKENKINMKLEVCKDKTSGKLSITAHFSSNAPNIIQNKDDFFWIPTSEEKDLLNEAFEMFPVDGGIVTKSSSTPEMDDKKHEEPAPEPVMEEEIKPMAETQPMPEENKPEDLPPLEEPNEPSVFEVTDENITSDDLEKHIDKKIEEIKKPAEEPPVEQPLYEEPKTEESDANKKEDEGLIVEADSEAIEQALKKHTAKDESIVEADEKTIIDKVLSQKKKGKWSKK